jgi:hypothetical protein
MVEEGTIEMGYNLAGLNGGVGIDKAESGAALNTILMCLLLFPYVDVQIYPLMTYDESIAQAKQALEALKA